MSRRIYYVRRTDAQVEAFLRAYVALCKQYKIHLAADQSYSVCPVLGGLCNNDPRWLKILRPAQRAGEY